MNDHEKDKYELIRFLKQSENILDNLIEDPKGLLLKEVIDNQRIWNNLQIAWKEAKIVIHKSVDKINSNETIGYLEELGKVGLTGNQLQHKLGLFDYFHKRFISERSLRWIRRLLGIIDTMYGSLSKVIPAMEIVKEFKEALEQLVKLKK